MQLIPESKVASVSCGGSFLVLQEWQEIPPYSRNSLHEMGKEHLSSITKTAYVYDSGWL